MFSTALPALSIAPPLPAEAVLLANVQFCTVQADPWFKMAPPEPAPLPEKVQPVRVSRFELTMDPPAKPEAAELPASVQLASDRTPPLRIAPALLALEALVRVSANILPVAPL